MPCRAPCLMKRVVTIQAEIHEQNSGPNQRCSECTVRASACATLGCVQSLPCEPEGGISKVHPPCGQTDTLPRVSNCHRPRVELEYPPFSCPSLDLALVRVCERVFPPWCTHTRTHAREHMNASLKSSVINFETMSTTALAWMYLER